MNVGYGGTGTASHHIGISLMRSAGLSATLISYRGPAQLHVDVMAGTVSVMIDTLSAAMGDICAGRLRSPLVSGA